MAFKPTYVRRKTCLPLYILCVKWSRFLSRRLQNVYQNMYNPSYVILETKINFQNAVTFDLVNLDTKFKVQAKNSLKQRILTLYLILIYC